MSKTSTPWSDRSATNRRWVPWSIAISSNEPVVRLRVGIAVVAIRMPDGPQAATPRAPATTSANPQFLRPLIQLIPTTQRLSVVGYSKGRGLPLAEGGHDVREHVGDLVSHGQKNHDHHDRNQNQDQGVLDHSLAALTSLETTRNHTSTTLEPHWFGAPCQKISKRRTRLLIDG